MEKGKGKAKACPPRKARPGESATEKRPAIGKGEPVMKRGVTWVTR